jgi:hypothetical protein
MQEQEDAASDIDPIMSTANMAYADELSYEFWRAPRILLIAFLAPFAIFFLWVAFFFVADLPKTWNYAIDDPEAAIQQYSLYIARYGASWLPFSLPLFFLNRQCCWLFYRLTVGRAGITYVITTTSITWESGAGPSITMPWAKMKGLARTKKLLLLGCGFFGWWYLPWRAFDAADQDRIWAYAQRRLAGKTNRAD